MNRIPGVIACDIVDNLNDDATDNAERWLPYPGSDFEVSDLGNVRSRAWGKLQPIRPFPNNVGYLMVGWRTTEADGTRRRHCKLVHRMVLEVFVGPQPMSKPHGCHYDGDRRNNQLSNLRWDSAAGNSMDNLRLGRGPQKLTADKAREIHRMLQLGHSTRKVGKKYGVSSVLVVKIGTGEIWGHATGQRRDALSASARAKATGRKVRSRTHWQARGEPHFVAKGTFGDPNLRAVIDDELPPGE